MGSPSLSKIMIILVIATLLASSFIGGIPQHPSVQETMESFATGLVDDVPPSVHILTPTAGQAFTDLIVQVTWEADDLGSGVNHTFLRLDSGNWLNVDDLSGFDAQLLQGGQHNVTIYVFDRAGNHAYDLVNFTIQIAPDAPESVNATAGASGIGISWATPFDGGSPILSFKVFRSLAPSAYGPIPLGNASTAGYLDSDVTAGTKYYYVVRASNARGDGPVSSEVNATLTDGPRPPDAPTVLTATSGMGFVSLSWSLPANQGESSVVAYIVYRTNIQGANPTSPLVTLNNGQRYYIDASLVSGTYFYKVSAVNFAEGPRSNESNAEVGGIQPGSPGTIVGMSLIEEAGAIKLSWQPPPEGASPIFRYLIYRSLVPFDPVLLNSTASTTYQDEAVVGGQTFHYWIVAENEQGQGPLSAMLSGAVQTPDNGIYDGVILASALLVLLIIGGVFVVWTRRRK